MSTYEYESFLFAGERDYDPSSITEWMRRSWSHSIMYSVLYLIFVFGGQRLMRRRKQFDLGVPLIFWNLFLATFSILGMVRFAPSFFYTLKEHGILYSACKCDYVSGVSGYWTTAFVLSKVFELPDTVFLVLRKRRVIFLHWYHHVTVLVYTWHAYKDHTAGGRWFIMMNYVVHSFMYSYYCLHAIGCRFPKWFPMSITVMQLGQMFGGCVVTGVVFWAKYHGKECEQTDDNLKLAVLMYSSYYFLFAQFFYKAYFVSKKYDSKDGRKHEESKNLEMKDETKKRVENGAIRSETNGFIAKADTNEQWDNVGWATRGASKAANGHIAFDNLPSGHVAFGNLPNGHIHDIDGTDGHLVNGVLPVDDADTGKVKDGPANRVSDSDSIGYFADGHLANQMSSSVQGEGLRLRF